MKKKIFVFILIILMISTPVFAGPMAATMTVAALFGALGGAGLLFAQGDYIFETLSYASIGLGGIFAICGILVGINQYIAEGEAQSDGLFLASSNGEAPSIGFTPVTKDKTVSPKAKDNIFNHLDFGTDGKNTYLGVRFSW